MLYWTRQDLISWFIDCYGDEVTEELQHKSNAQLLKIAKRNGFEEDIRFED